MRSLHYRLADAPTAALIHMCTHMQAKGHVNDELLLTAPPVPKTFKIPKVIHAHAILQLGLTNQETASLQPEVR